MPTDLRVAVIGSGAMGSLYGGRLAASGVEVTLVDIWTEHIETIREQGLRITSSDDEETIDVAATTNPESIESVELVLLFVKSTATETAMADAAETGLLNDADVLTLQNGLGNPETIAEFVPEKRVIAGVTSHGATMDGPGQIFHAGAGPTSIGRYFAENDDHVKRIARTLQDAGFETIVTDAVRDAIWEKVLVNIGINAPTALARVKNGTLATTAPGRRIVETAVMEAARVAHSEGHDIRQDIVDHVLAVAETTGGNRSSMRQDVEAGRKTEIEKLHGAVVARADRVDINAPVNRTLADLVRLAETDTEET